MNRTTTTTSVPASLRRKVTDAARRDLADVDHDGPALDPLLRIAGVVTREAPLLEGPERERLIRSVANGVIGLGVIDELLSAPEVTDIVVNGPGPVWVDRSGRLERTPFVVDSTEIARCIERLVAPLGLRADRSNPVVDARLADGSRVTVVLPPVAPDGPLLSIRRHPDHRWPIATFASPAQTRTIERIVSERLNVVIYGATGSGKTSLLASMLDLTAPEERLVVVEDTVELPLRGDNVVRLESRSPGPSGAGGMRIRDLVRVSLRLRPDRLIVGEVRGAEALDMIWAMSTGHRGSMSTCHASSAHDAVTRLETMMLLGASNLSALSVRKQISSAVDVLIGMQRVSGGGRIVAAIDLLGSSGRLRGLTPRGGSV